MKKLAWFVAIALVVFLILTYLSLNYTDERTATCELVGPGDLENINFREHDSVLVAASTLYEANFLKELMQGEHYRDAWAAPVRVPIVFLDTLLGGMRIEEKGGGKQTHSLDVRSADGTLYSLRSISKDPSPLVPGWAEVLGLENIVIDGISAQHPYGALVAARLSDAAGLLHTHPRLYFVPEQPTLGIFNEDYGNRLFYLEYETEGEVNWTGLDNVVAIVETDELQEFKLEHKHVAIDKAMLARARLFDILIGDWDRHAEQWGWVIQEKDSSYIATPLAGDRDNAFFTLDGVLPNLIANKKLLPGVQAFDEEVAYTEGLVMPFDVYFLKTADKETFVSQAQILQDRISDKVISEAMQAWPERIRELNSEEIGSKIKSRRDALPEIAVKFYEALQEEAFLTEPLNGSEDERAGMIFLSCFECPPEIEPEKARQRMQSE